MNQASPVAINPLAKQVKILSTGLLSDIPERASVDSVVARHAHCAYFGVLVVLGRVPLQNHVTSVGSDPLEAAHVEQHLHDVVT